MTKQDRSTPKPRNIVMPDELWEAVRIAAFDARVSMSRVVRDALENYQPLAPYRSDDND